MQPLMFDLCAGLGGATEGFLAAGWHCIGVDIERHQYGDHRYPAQLWIQDLRTIHGSQLRDADFIWASPPCQEFSWMAMPWSRAKQVARALRGEDEFPAGYRGSRTIGELTALFGACFRIQREASAAAGRHIPMVVENVRGAEPWVGRARGRFGSFLLWGDVPALMPSAQGHIATKNSGGSWFAVGSPGQKEVGRNPVHEGAKAPGMNWSDQTKRGQDFTRLAGQHAAKQCAGIKQGGDWFNASQPSISRQCSSKSDARKAASARIAKIPPVLSRYIAATYRPDR